MEEARLERERLTGLLDEGFVQRQELERHIAEKGPELKAMSDQLETSFQDRVRLDAALVDLRVRYQAMEEHFRIRTNHTESEASRLQAEAARLQSEIMAIRATKTFRYTQRLRRIYAKLRRRPAP